MLPWMLCLVLISTTAACLECGSETRQEPLVEVAPEPKEVAAPVVRRAEPLWHADDDAKITIALPGRPLHLNPILAGDALALRVTLGDVYEALLATDKTGHEPHAGLAQSFVRSVDGKEWTFYLRRGVFFHNGQRLRASDVVFSFELARKSTGPLKADLDDLQRVVIAAPDEIVFRFGQARASRSETFASVPIVSRASFKDARPGHLQEAEASSKPNGTGPLRFVSWQADRISLTRFDRYWGTASRARDLVYRVIPDRARIIAELRSGALDVAMRMPVEEAIEAALDNPALQLVQESLPAYTAAVFNTQAPLLDIDTRLALSQSFDRPTIVSQLFRGYGEQAVGPYIKGSDSNEPSASPVPFTLDPVKQIPTDHWKRSAKGLRLLVPKGSRTMERLADIWAQDMREVVPVEILRLPFADMLTRVRKGDFEVCLLSFSTSSQVELFSLFHSSHIGGSNLSGLSDPAVDVLVAGTRIAQNAEERRDRGRELHRLLLNLAPMAFLTSDRRLGLIQGDIAGVGDSARISGARNLWRRQ